MVFQACHSLTRAPNNKLKRIKLNGRLIWKFVGPTFQFFSNPRNISIIAATYDIVTELRALLFIVNFDHFTINIVNEKRSG